VRVTPSQFKQILKEELEQELEGLPSEDETNKFLDRIITNKFKMLRLDDIKTMRGEIMQAIEQVLGEYQPDPLMEKAPPGREDQVKALKKKYCGGKDDCPKAFKMAWASHNKDK